MQPHMPSRCSLSGCSPCKVSALCLCICVQGTAGYAKMLIRKPTAGEVHKCFPGGWPRGEEFRAGADVQLRQGILQHWQRLWALCAACTRRLQDRGQHQGCRCAKKPGRLLQLLESMMQQLTHVFWAARASQQVLRGSCMLMLRPIV